MKEKIKEFAKNILIVLLICSLLLLTIAAIPSQSVRNTPWLSQLLQPIAPLLGLPEAELTYVAQSTSVPDAAQPIAISVRNETGRCTAMWDFSELDQRFDSLSPLLGQALNTAGNFNQVSQSQVETALSGSGIFFRYSSLLPASLIAFWNGAQLDAAVPDSDICILSAQEKTVTLYLLGQQYYMAETRLASELLLEAIRPYNSDGSRFAFEDSSALSAFSLLPGGSLTVPSATVSNPCDSHYIDALATTLGFNPYGEGRYTDEQGTVLFSETNASLRITADGEVTYTGENTRFVADSMQPQALAESARALSGLVLDSVPGDGRVYLSEFSQDGQSTVCRFEYLLSGIPVTMANPAVTVTFDGQRITQAVVYVRSFTGTNKLTYPLPVAQASAVLEAGSRLELAYRINADSTLSAGWLQ